MISPLAGKPATRDMLVDWGAPERAYYAIVAEVSEIVHNALTQGGQK